MPIQAPRALAAAQRAFKRDFRALRTATAQQARMVLLSAATLDGTIPADNLTPVQERIGRMISAEYVVGRNAFAQDGVTALSPYARLLNAGIASVTRAVVHSHHVWLQRNVPEDVYRWLLSGQGMVSEQFHPNPLADYDTAHTFVDPNGYILSDRIWQVNVRARVQVDQLLAEGIRRGDSAVNIAKRLEQFMVPGRAKIRTRTPYGNDGSYDARRLARTEITAAHGRAMIVSAKANPYVETIDWVLSPSHPEIDICDDLAAGSPYALDSVPSYPAHPHDLCHLRSNTRPTAEVTEELRAMIAANEPPPYTTPANERSFLFLLLGALALLDVDLTRN
jgi:hypothetical protein